MASCVSSSFVVKICHLADALTATPSLLSGGWAILVVCCAVFSTFGLDKGNAAIGISVLAGGAFSAPLALLNASAQLAVPKNLVGLATGQIIAARYVLSTLTTITQLSSEDFLFPGLLELLSELSSSLPS